MKYTTFLFAISIFVFSCSEKHKDLKAESVKIIELNHGKGIIFPATYSKKILIHPDKIKGVFTPDEKTIRYIDKSLSENYESLITKYQKDTPNFSVLKKDLGLYDKQFLGYIDPEHDSIVLCNIFNLTKSNPNNLKRRIVKEYVSGSGFWFDRNMLEFKFDKKTKKFIHAYEE